MNLQTKIPLDRQSENLINYNSSVLLLGSCFSEHIGDKFEYFKFQNRQNPFGILFHPKAIEALIVNAVERKAFSEKDVFLQNEHWYCFDAHSKLGHSSKEDLIQHLNKQLVLTAQQLSDASHIIITLGTAWVYNHIKTQKTVANCHKVPQGQFKKELLSVESIFLSLKHIVSTIKKVNKKAVVIFTVSPVRHLKDGFSENTQSKAHIVAAIHQFINQKSLVVNGNSYYFPSYEIMMDELRDYRFYAEDMIHPNQMAINYIWEKFKKVWISNEALKTMEEVDAIQKGLQHKPFNPNSEAHQKFLQNLDSKIKTLQSQCPNISF